MLQEPQLALAHRAAVLCPVQHGTEHLREWMASHVLKPLVRAIDGAHTAVIDTAARIGWQGIQLQPLAGQGGERCSFLPLPASHCVLCCVHSTT